MAGIGLSSVLNGDFIRRLSSLGGSSQPANQALNGEPSGAKAISAGLRIGARTFSTALQGLNDAVSIVNLSRKTLEDLSSITDKLIAVTKRATDVASSKDSREKLAIEFKALANEFRLTVKNATTGDNEFLTKDGLAEIFKTVGLDENSSESIARIFSQFVTPPSDGSLASEYDSGGEASIPIGAFSDHVSDATVLRTKVSGLATTSGKISTVNGAYVAQDSLLNQNPGYNSLLATGTNGDTRALIAGALSADIQLLNVDPDSGYSVIQSSDNLFGNLNPTHVNQLFLVDASGTVIHQYTDNLDSALTYTSADISADALSVGYSYDDTGKVRVERRLFDTLGVSGTGVTSIIASAGTGIRDYEGVKISNNGSYLAFQDVIGVSPTTYFYSVGSGTFNATVLADTQITHYGFITDTKLAYINHAGTDTLRTIAFASGAPKDVQTGLGTITAFSTLENSLSSEAAVSFYDSSTYRVETYKDQGDVLTQSIQLAAGDTVTDLSLAYNERDSTKVDTGILGSLGSMGSSESNLYRFSFNFASSTRPRASRSTPVEYDPITDEQRNSIFDPSRSIANRAEAYRTLNDLKALKSQISKNLGALDNASEMLGDNIDLVRAAGKAFLDLSDQVRSSDDADTLAGKLRDRIRRAGSSALAQADNLNAITVAALTHSSE